MLLQGWNDRLRIFPAVPVHWRDVAFRDLVAEGAWVVSATRLDGRTAWVRIKAQTDRKLRLKNPFGLEAVTVSGAALSQEGADYVGDLVAGQEVVLAVAGVLPDLEEAIVQVRRSELRPLGLN
jgi:alpha-L-fucosidase 2